MLMGWVFTGFILLSVIFSFFGGGSLSAALAQGAQKGVSLAISLGGSLCLWSGVGHLAQRTGLTERLGKLLSPLLGRVFPSSRRDSALAGALSGNFTANLLGLGNAATPLGIQAARMLRDPARPDLATGELCRLIVLNTASVQLIPGTVAALRASLGSPAPFDILPAVWVSSLLSAGLGVAAAAALERVWPRE